VTLYITLGFQGIEEVMKCRWSGKKHVLSDCATIAVILFQARNVMSYLVLVALDFIICLVFFQLQVHAYTCINHTGDGAD